VSPSFFRFWGDFGSLKNLAQLRWETATMLANGSQCSLGDQMHPRGRLVPEVYERIGQAYAAVAEREPWCVDAAPVTEIAVLIDDSREEFGIATAPDAVWGVTRILMETQCQFDLIDAQSPLDKYRLVILPDNRDIDGLLVKKIRAFIQRGGALFVEGLAAYSPTTGGFLMSELGITYAGMSPHSVNYLQMEGAFCGAVPDMPCVVRYPLVQVVPADGTMIRARTLTPYLERTPEHFTSHRHAPWGMTSPYPALVQRAHVIYSAAPICAAYHRDADTNNRLVFARCLDELLPRRLVQVEGLPMLEASLLRQGDRLVLHLVHFAANRRGTAPEVIEVIPPLASIPVQIRCAARPKRVYLAPSRQELEFGFPDGYVRVVVPTIDIHQMVVVE
jgi:hypothetical protein